MNAWVKAFVAGALSVLLFHQGLVALLHLADVIPFAPYNLKPVPPLGVPAVLSSAFFGGLWGLLLWALLRRLSGGRFLGAALLFGLLGPPTVAMLLVFPLKGIPVAATTWVMAWTVNAAWGLGTAILIRLADRLPLASR